MSVTLKDTMYEFLQNPFREKFSELVRSATGEENTVEFKREWIDEQKLAEIILGIANTDSGVIVFGVEENEDCTYTSCGIECLKDKAIIHQKISKYLPPNLLFEIYDFDYSGEEYARLKDKKFQVIIISAEEEKLPYVCIKSGDCLKEGAIYVRRGTRTMLANAVEVERLLNRRIETMHSTASQLELEEHLMQLQVLYDSITRRNDIFWEFDKQMEELEPINPNYPTEDFEAFIARMISEKKRKIETVLDLN